MGGVRLSSWDFKKPVGKALKDNDGPVFVHMLLHYERSWVMEEGGTTNKDSFSPLSHTNTAIQPSINTSSSHQSIPSVSLQVLAATDKEPKNASRPILSWQSVKETDFRSGYFVSFSETFSMSVRWHTDEMRAGEEIKNRLMVVENSPEAVQFWLSSKKKNRNFPYNPDKNAYIKGPTLLSNINLCL